MKKLLLVALPAFLLMACGGRPEVDDDEEAPAVVEDSGTPTTAPTAPNGSGNDPDPIFGDDDMGPEPNPGCSRDGGVCGEIGDAGPACGDGVRDESEECDDGNSLPGDGCNGACAVEPNSECPEPGRACTSTLICGDGVVDPGEFCDDGNTAEDDGCSADCTEQDPAFVCVPGERCFRLYACGDGRVTPAAGETCDDANAVSGDGCSADCAIEAGYTCPVPGAECEVVEYCGDGRLSAGEQCEDGGMDPDDGCSPECRIETDWACDPDLGCVYLVECGDGIVNGGEACDDGNAGDGDGCDATCSAVEVGWECTRPGFACRTSCGDGLVRGLEQCDDGGRDDGDGCSANCTVEPNTLCTGEPSVCGQAVCGQNGKEGTEPCDDGNNDWGDGCTPTCQIEPSCAPGAPCSSACGDGIKFPSEACDDGNTSDGDGCSATCEVEAGFTCTIDDVDLEQLDLPVVYRDFAAGAPHAPTTLPTGITAGHTDFEWPVSAWGVGAPPNGTYEDNDGNLANNTQDEVWARDINLAGFRPGMVRATLGATDDGALAGKPVFAFEDLDGGGDCPLAVGALRRDGEGYCAHQVRNSESFGQWFRDVEGVNTAVRSALILRETADGTFVYDSNTHAADGTPYAEEDELGFWPLDALGTTGTQCSGTERNFHFTSEVHHWFQFDAANPPTLTFTGDDDVFVFIGGQLALDLGGVHSRLEGVVALDANGDATMAITDGGDELASGPVALGLLDGSIYEIVVFQAERNQCESNYRLELKNFNLQRSKCEPRCGDGIVTLGEECDDGDENAMTPLDEPPNNTPTPEYDGCTADVCTLGPYCGDGVVNGEEPCDNGSNRSIWGDDSTNACSPGCVVPPACGDGNVDSPFEECDDGPNNSEEGYESCTTDCLRGPFCGDGVENGPETCDDGANDGRYGGCTPECEPAPYCGDGTVQEEWGEQCDGGENCSANCRLGAQCGDGVVQEHLDEQCDDGVNAGGYGECGPMCTYGPRCGDGVTNGPEQCDDGVNDGGYGECDQSCRLGPRCGDGVKNGPEQCDDGNDSSSDGCTPTCRLERPGAR